MQTEFVFRELNVKTLMSSSSDYDGMFHEMVMTKVRGTQLNSQVSRSRRSYTAFVEGATLWQMGE